MAIRHIVTRIGDVRYLPTHGYNTGAISDNTTQSEIVDLGVARFESGIEQLAMIRVSEEFSTPLQVTHIFITER